MLVSTLILPIIILLGDIEDCSCCLAIFVYHVWSNKMPNQKYGRKLSTSTKKLLTKLRFLLQEKPFCLVQSFFDLSLPMAASKQMPNFLTALLPYTQLLTKSSSFRRLINRNKIKNKNTWQISLMINYDASNSTISPIIKNIYIYISHGHEMIGCVGRMIHILSFISSILVLKKIENEFIFLILKIMKKDKIGFDSP